ncbi:peptidoglycan editing factor PgeF [Pisciglobus halotolerans]|uniref:Purine nucleoside phosphorylase n=1 Tax=Pisciglobus halotolerans TaxID=745365 RepID=A0A1I3BTU3_9LACT|nr:peptidoglycan editing factor PgeF [Pisciglobus halotolerans]SFH65379.1 conserved hypothetical protein [Pisciglobus halotolerans]
MHSILLEKHGLIHYIAGSNFNFRYQQIGDSITEQIEMALSEMGIAPGVVYSGSQVHGKAIQYCDGENGAAAVFGRTFPDTDGLITDKKGVALLIKFADCTPIVLFDPIHQVQASVHSGWRGTLQQISVEAIKKMEKEFGTKREDLVVFVGPSIDQDHYEVGAEVYEAFKAFKDRDTFFKPSGKKYLLSMIDANLSILKQAGLKEEQIDICRESTFTSDHLHSARQEGKDYQLNGMITMLGKA